MELLKLVALDQEDLAVISAHLQDAALRVDEMAYLPKERRFALCARRLDWEADLDAPQQRRLTGLHFERVSAVRCKNIDPKQKDLVLTLLAVTFTPAEEPSGAITLIFGDDRMLRLEVECVEAQMRDMGPVWETQAQAQPVREVEKGR